MVGALPGPVREAVIDALVKKRPNLSERHGRSQKPPAASDARSGSCKNRFFRVGYMAETRRRVFAPGRGRVGRVPINRRLPFGWRMNFLIQRHTRLST